MMTNDAAFISCRKRLANVCFCASDQSIFVFQKRITLAAIKNTDKDYSMKQLLIHFPILPSVGVTFGQAERIMSTDAHLARLPERLVPFCKSLAQLGQTPCSFVNHLPNLGKRQKVSTAICPTWASAEIFAWLLPNRRKASALTVFHLPNLGKRCI